MTETHEKFQKLITITQIKIRSHHFGYDLISDLQRAHLYLDKLVVQPHFHPYALCSTVVSDAVSVCSTLNPTILQSLSAESTILVNTIILLESIRKEGSSIYEILY